MTDALGSYGAEPALVGQGEAITYAELDRRIDDVASTLGESPRLVLLTLDATVDGVVTYLAALRGGHPVILTAAADDGAHAALVDAYDPDVVAHGGEIAERRHGSAHALHPDLAVLMSTSGSTGTPKLVRLSHDNLVSNAAAIVEVLGIEPRDRAITTLPLHYCYGLSVLNSYLLAGASVVLSDLSVVDECFWTRARAEGVTSIAGVPHTFDLLERIGFTGAELPALRYITQAGGRMAPELVRRYAQLGRDNGFELFVMYGQTEATARMASLAPALTRDNPHAIGTAVPGGELRIDGSDADGVGELVYRGPNVMLGYAQSAADLSRGATIDELRTGDLARRTPDGLFQIVGRKSRFVKPFGVRIDLDHVERLLADDGVTAVCTGDDARLVVGVVGASDGVAASLETRLRLPRRCVTVVALECLPRLANGKPDYETVRAQADRPGSGPVATLRDAFAVALGVEPHDDDTFVSLGGDSLSYVEVSIWLEDVLGEVPRDWHTTTVAELEATATPPRNGRRWSAVDSTVALRAALIVLVVGTHTRLWHQMGGAHALLAVAGFNFARFQLTSRSVLRSAARVAIPSAIWIGAVAAVSAKVGWPHALLVNDLLGASDSVWSYWFLEALVQISVPLAVVLMIPRMADAERRRPFGFAAAAVALGLVARFDLIPSPADHVRTWPHEVFWLFALGWAAARATANWQRLVITAVAVACVPGFFDNPSRSALVIGALTLITWVPTVPAPRRLLRLITPLAGASLYIYLTHIQIHPALGRATGPVTATLGSLAFGIAAWRVSQKIEARFT